MHFIFMFFLEMKEMAEGEYIIVNKCEEQLRSRRGRSGGQEKSVGRVQVHCKFRSESFALQ